MISKRSAYRGCLLGLAVGDAMGYTVDSKCWAHIQEDYGPNGLLGYDLVNGYADGTSHTQLCAFTCNGLLLGLTRGQLQGTMAPFIKYIALSQREWAIGQRRYNQPRQNYCWVFRVNELRRRHCTDTRMVDTLNRPMKCSLEDPVNRFDGPASLASAAAVGMFAQRERMDQHEIDRLGAEAVALTYGSPIAFITGAVLASVVNRVLHDQQMPLKDLFLQAMEGVDEEFGYEYPQTAEVLHILRHAITLSEDEKLNQRETMEHLVCENAAQALAGAFYAILTCQDDFDSAMITAVNHSGRSSAVACITGAVLGARMGEEALPEFYMECLETAEVLRVLADDLVDGCPMEQGNRMFDLDWDRKYLHGEP
ncbi:MAG: ADP-ribosylglycohydrolase family protein [Oscillospiraceae bacterium]|nr:ADP-ribosylglycohydrolase family protein [Oscillospiraceae bacterium]